MSLTAAVSGFILLFIQVVQGQNGWAVTYSSTEVCALKGSTVELSCTYTQPSAYTAEESFWFTKVENRGAVDLSTDSEYTGRVMSTCHGKHCTLRISDLRDSDSAEYKFRLITNQPDGKYSAAPGVTLSVTDLQVTLSPYWRSGRRELMCHSGCILPPQSTYAWYKNAERIPKATSSSLPVNPGYGDSFSCSLEEHMDLPSPPFCAYDYRCEKVTYSNRRICAPKGSSVDVSCTYKSYGSISSKSWFSPGSNAEWQSPSRVVGRVQVLDNWRGLSSLRISDLTESDSAEYRFKFTSSRFEWRSSLPGTTLAVTDLQVQVRQITSGESNTQAELRCHSSCSPAGPLSYVWFRNSRRITGEETSSYTGWVSPGEEISCAFKGHDRFPSPAVYAPKRPSVSVSPSGEIMEGSSVNLTCSSDANPAAIYTWYKKTAQWKQQSLRKGPELHFESIQSSDSGEYHCEAENELGKRTAEHRTIHVEYPPRPPSVSVSPSDPVMEGSSVNLTCSSDAHPAATYTWYKKTEATPKTSGPVFTISDVRVEDSGDYYCETRNSRGHQNSTLLTLSVFRSMKSVAAGSISAVFLFIIFLLVILFIWRKRSPKETSQPTGRSDNNRQTPSPSQPAEEEEELSYASMSFSKQQDEPVYSNISPVLKRNRVKRKEEEDEDDVDYAMVDFQSIRPSPKSKTQGEDKASSAVYSTVMTTPRA